MTGDQQHGGPQFSDDGKWWWDGRQWQPAVQRAFQLDPATARMNQRASGCAVWLFVFPALVFLVVLVVGLAFLL